MFEDERNITIGMLFDSMGPYTGGIRVISAGTGNVLIKDFMRKHYDLYGDLLISCWNIEIYVDPGKYADTSYARSRLVVSVLEDEFYRIRDMFK